MTNAHVVGWARQLVVRRYQDPKPYQARVVFVANDCDLALIEVEDPAFYDGMEALEIGDLPLVRSTVVTYGYPSGGEQISYTRGVVSRVEVQNFVHIGNRSFLAVQTDAAINPGNSGGPVIQDDKVVGVAFQGIPGLENAGFFIPPPIINHVLKDIEDGKYDGFPQAGIRLASLQNAAYRRYLKLPNNEVGARVDHIFDIKPSQDLLKIDDVLLQVGKYPVASDGTILYNGHRVFVSVAFAEAQHGESVPLKVWREGKPMDINLPVEVYKGDLREGNQYDVLPRYFVYGGLVFTPLSRDYLRTLGGGAGDPTAAPLLYELYYRRQEAPHTMRQEPIVLASVLAHDVNADLGTRGRVLVDKVNGVRIEKLEDVIRAIEGNKGEQDVIEFYPDSGIEALDRKPVQEANPQILKLYGIAKDRRL